MKTFFLQWARRDVDELIARAVRGDATPDDVAWLDAWRSRSPRNERRYAQTVRVLDTFGDLPRLRREPPTVAALLARDRSRPELARRSSRRLLAVTAVTAVASAAAAVIVIAVGASFFRERFSRNDHSPKPLADGAGFTTGPSEMATVHLSDGSVVRLAPNSRLGFSQRAAAREASLEGRAFFAVARIPSRPFRVRTRLGEATVLGTSFELATDSSELKLVVLTGRVALAGPVNHLEVHAGEVSAIRNGTVAEPQRVANAEGMQRWVGKFLTFQATPMAQVAREFEETYGIRLVARDSAIANRTVTGTFVDRDARYVIDAVCAVVNAQCLVRGAEVVMTSP